MAIKDKIEKAKETKKKFEKIKKIFAILKIVGPILLILLLLIIFLAFLGFLFGDSEDTNDTATTDTIPTLTIGENGLFKTKAKKEWHLFTTNTYKYYAVLDEEAFRKYISSKNLDTKFSKNESLTDFFENEEDFIKGKLSKLGENEEENSENKENTKNEEDAEKEEMMKEYGFLKELIIRLTASGYPEDVEFVLNKTLIFDSDEDAKNEDIINEKIDELVDESDTKTVSGGVSIYRNGNKLKYVATSDQLDDAYYTMNKKGEIVVRYTETEIQDANSTTKQGEVKKNKPLNFSELIDPYIIDIDFITALNSRLGSEHFLYYLSLLVSQSHIDLGIYENTTHTKLELKENYQYDVYDSNGNFKYTEYSDPDEGAETKQERIGRNIEIQLLNVDNWVATIHKEIIEVKGEEEEIYNETFKQGNYEDLINKIKANNSNSSKALLNKIEQRVLEFAGSKIKYRDNSGDYLKTKLIDEHISLTSQTTEYKLDEKKSTYKDNTDYFCGLIRNSTSTKTFSKDIYTCEDNNRKDLNAYLLKTSVDTLEGEQLDNVFQKFDSKGKSMLYVETGTNKLICPDIRLSNESERQAFLVISGGKYDETINLIWDKLCGIKDGSTSIEDIKFKELEPQDINETNLNLKSFTKSWEGTRLKLINNTYYHISYIDRLSIPTTGWGINLFVTYDIFEKYLGDIVYTPAFYIAKPNGTNNELNSFIIPDNIVEIVFNKIINNKINSIENGINEMIDCIVNGKIRELRAIYSSTIPDVPEKHYYDYNIELINKYGNIKVYERDALVDISHGFGNIGYNSDYLKCIENAFKKSNRKNSEDKDDRINVMIYYDYLRNNLRLKDGYKYFAIQSDGTLDFGDEMSFILYSTRSILQKRRRTFCGRN